MSKTELFDEDLMDVNGGQITYTWNGESGTIGMNGRNPYILVNKAAFIQYFNSVRGTVSDADILRHLLSEGIAKRP